MVEAILRMFRKETSGLHQAAFLLGIFALSSQVLALVRDKLLAYTFGATSSLDVYYASFRIPDFLFVTLGSLVSLSVLIPFIISEMEKNDGKIRVFVDGVFSVFLALIIVISAGMFLFVPILVPKFFPGFDTSQVVETVTLSRILLLSPILLGISNLLGSLTQANNRFIVYALSPLLYNAGIIVGIVFLFPLFGLSGIVWGVVIGALFHGLVQIPTVKHLGLLPRITLKPEWSRIKNVMRLALPRTFALSVSHITIFFLISMASLIAEGSISVFNLSWNLQSVPLSIFGVSYTLAAFPALSKLFVAGEREQFRIKFITSAKHIIFWLVPFTAIFVVLRAHIVRVILGAGEFSWTDTRLTAAALALFSLSLIFQAIVLLCIRALYAMGITGKPFSITILSGFATVVFSFVLSKLFEVIPTFRFFFEDILNVPDVPGTAVMMLALGFTLGSFLEAVLLWRFFAKAWSGITKALYPSVIQVVFASVILGVSAYFSLRFFNTFISLETFFGVLTQGLLSGVVGMICWFGSLTFLKNPELEETLSTLHARFWKSKPTSPDSTVV